MRPALCFCMPAHGRLRLAQICMEQLRRTCDALCAEGIEASAIVVAVDENLDTARHLGFGTVERDNGYLSRRFNDALQLAFDSRHNPRPFTHAVPVGSDDWVDYRLFIDLPPADTVVGFQWASFVSEDGREIVAKHIAYPGGVGIRIYPRQIMAGLGFRPADEDRYRGCDTSILYNVQRHHGDHVRLEHRHLHERQIVDWKTAGEQLNTYRDLRRHRGSAVADPFVELEGIYPAESLEAMRAHYATVGELVAA